MLNSMGLAVERECIDIISLDMVYLTKTISVHFCRHTILTFVRYGYKMKIKTLSRQLLLISVMGFEGSQFDLEQKV